ncbi:LysR family transcriptional regulator [Sphingobium aromaticiconvertens]|uniref:LysR family transcriptional regulator n=1 Tax=Sphingobium aromaticiconvertens TaxID=365341 RepID=UPI003016BEE0
MDLRNLRHLVAIARRLSFSRAAEDLGLSQSALTRSIQSLERQAGMRLFDRDRTKVSVTPLGSIVVERASALLADADDFERMLRQTARGEEGRLCFGMAPLPAWTLLPTALSEWINAAPALTNEVVVRNVEALWPLLIAGDIEFFVSVEGQVPDAPPVRAETLGLFPFTLIVRAGHPLLLGNCPGATFPVLISSRGGIDVTLLADLRDWAAGPPHVIEDYNTLVSLTKTTDAIWVSSAYSVIRDLESKMLFALDLLNGSAPENFRMVMYSLDRRSQSPGMLRLKQALRQRIRDLQAPSEHNHDV